MTKKNHLHSSEGVPHHITL